MSFLSKTIGKIVGSGNNSQNSQSQTQSNPATKSQSVPVQSFHYNQAIGSSSNTSNNNSSALHQDAQLTLTHLRKLFYEYLHPKNPHINESDRRDDKLYNILPLFIKVINLKYFTFIF